MIKKAIALLSALVLIICCFAGCSDTKKTDDGKISIVCTLFPMYDWARNIIGENNDDVELTLLLDSGTDLHSYQPNAADIIKITSADLFIYVGGTSDKWVDDVFKTSPSDTVKINLMEVLGEGVFDEETVEGMEAEEEEETDEKEYDEHVWLSLKNADKFCTYIKDALIKLDPAHQKDYEANCGNYRQDLAVLSGDYTEAVNKAKRKTILFADRFPFRYLVEDLGLDYYAAFAGCSTETSASFETIIFLANVVDNMKLPTILVTETSDRSVAKTVKDTTESKDAEILVMDALQSVTSEAVKNGTTYLGSMRNNLEILKKALA